MFARIGCLLAALTSAIGLAGCATALITGVQLNQAAVMRSPDGTITHWKGTVQGHAFGDSPFELRELASGVVCKGSTDNSGKGMATCSDGTSMSFDTPPRLIGLPNGSYVGHLPDGRVYATGWGFGANLAELEKMLPKKSTASPERSPHNSRAAELKTGIIAAS